jgi:hypothetical protein
MRTFFGAGLLALAAGVLATAAPAEPRDAIRAKEVADFESWSTCIVGKANSLERSSETPSDIATTAVEECESPEAEYAADILYYGGTLDVDALHADMRNKAIAEVVRVRACRTGSTAAACKHGAE